MLLLLQLFWLRALLAVSAAASAFAVMSQPPSSGSCGEWSAWESRAWGGATRYRETCGDGRLDEQCRSGLGLVTTCRLANSEGGGGIGGDFAASAPQFDARRPAAKIFTYRGYYSYYSPTYYYVPSYYTYSYSSVTFVCSVGCIIGSAVGALICIGGIIGGIIVFYCMCFKGRPRGGIIGPSSVATTTATTVVATHPSNMVAVYPTYGNPALDTAAYPNAYPNTYPNGYPNTYPPAYPGMEQQNLANTYPPPYPLHPPPPSYQ